MDVKVKAVKNATDDKDAKAKEGLNFFSYEHSLARQGKAVTEQSLKYQSMYVSNFYNPDLTPVDLIVCISN